ncbi:hypothetical protein, partial [Alistipes putredinis]|uniref:hypothetical protein n=1 Tax=Alistipes putredinis TaxID=28117 RepID=UPI002FDB4B12
QELPRRFVVVSVFPAAEWIPGLFVALVLPCPFFPGKVRINSSLLFYSRLILNFCPYSLGQKADKFAFVPGLFVALHKIGCDSAIFACNPARLLSPFPVFDIALDGMRREKTANKFPFSPGFHYLCTLWKR